MFYSSTEQVELLKQSRQSTHKSLNQTLWVQVTALPLTSEVFWNKFMFFRLKKEDCKLISIPTTKDFPRSSVSKESACSTGDPSSIPGMGRSPGEGNGNPLQCSCLENPMGRGTWWTTAHGVARVRLNLVTKPPAELF